MEKNELQQHKKLLRCLGSLPKQIMNLSSFDNATEFVLHGLCSKDCFNLYKAAYFVDNPDFDMIKGVAGFSKDEGDLEWQNIWEDPESFTLFTKSLPFNKKVRTFASNSYKRKNQSFEKLVESIANDVGFEKPAYCVWDMRHFNHGLLVYEKVNDDKCELFNEHFVDSLYLLNFCPMII